MNMTDFIQNDLQARLPQLEATNLTLTQLAEHYGVSLTPVREAVARLVESGVLQKQANGRLAAKESRPQQEAPQAGTMVPVKPTDWTAVIAADLLLKSYEGAPTFVREEATAQAYGIGRTVVRRVFSECAGAGILAHVPRRGWLVQPLRREDLAAYVEVRETLEVKALHLAKGKLEKSELEKMLRGNRQVGVGEDQRLDNDLHNYMIERAGNRFIKAFFDQNGSFYSALFDHATNQAHEEVEMAGQHRSILMALIEEKWEQAERELRIHIRAQLPILEKAIKQLAKGLNGKDG